MTDDNEITDAMAEGAAEELHHIASHGKQWNTAGHDVQQHFRAVVRQVIDAGNTAELVARSKRQGVLPR